MPLSPHRSRLGFHPGRFPVLVFTLVYIAVFTAAALIQGNHEFILYIATIGVLIALLAVLDWRVRFSQGSLWALSAWGLSHLAGGMVPIDESVLYNYRPHENLPKYDQVIHFLGFGVATLVAWEALRAAVARWGNPPPPAAGLVIASVLIGMGLGALNEVIEFMATRTLAKTNVGGYVNTGWDLVSNMLGAIAAGLVIYAMHRPRE